jgi:hypothetical protein
MAVGLPGGNGLKFTGVHRSTLPIFSYVRIYSGVHRSALLCTPSTSGVARMDSGVQETNEKIETICS